MEQQNAKFSFFYLLSLVGLIFTALGVGMIIFQIINKKIIDAVRIYPGGFDAGVLKFAISAIIIAAPVYFILTWLINKNLLNGNLGKDSQARKGMTYFILFISSVVMIGWFIAVIYNFLDGELTAKFVLKAVTAIIIAATVFSFYFYDIKRENVKDAKNIIIKSYYFGSIAVVFAALVAGLFFVDSPRLTRDRKEDLATMDRFSRIESAIAQYYSEKQKLPDSLDELIEGVGMVSKQDLVNPVSHEEIGYKIINKEFYELCATFKTSNKEDYRIDYYQSKWKHDAGYKCLGQKVESYGKFM